VIREARLRPQSRIRLRHLLDGHARGSAGAHCYKKKNLNPSFSKILGIRFDEDVSLNVLSQGAQLTMLFAKK
jgi:hypothetical protein